MIRPVVRRNMAVWRIVISLLAGAVAALVASPMASATPETDADAAITAAWQASGGDGGSLGAREGDVYAVGSGFAANFADGKMFFTPDTGAHYVQGAILEKYESLGGPADGDLGFPTIDEGPGRAADSRNSTFSAADKPVIFWTPDTGAHVVRGAINAAWDRLGGSAGVLGVPTEDEVPSGNDMLSQRFTGGQVNWNRKTNTFTTDPPDLADQLAGLTVPTDPASAIAAARRAAGGVMGPLGAKDGDPLPIDHTDGVVQKFASGEIFYSPETGANALTDQVAAKYESVGGPTGDLGFPTSSETGGDFGPNSRIATFAAADEPVIFWTPDFGAVIVRGAMNAAWQKLGGAAGDLGAPKSDQTEDGNIVTQQFNGGSISWDRSDNTYTTDPSRLAAQLSGLQIPGLDTEPAQAGPAASQADSSKPFSWHWSWWWLLALIPVLLVVGLIAGSALPQRRRGRADDEFAADDFDDDEPYDSDADGDQRTTSFATTVAPAASPYDEPTDVAIPISGWAVVPAAQAEVDDEADTESEEAADLLGGYVGPQDDDEHDDVYEADFDDGDDDFDDDDFDDDDFDDDDYDDEFDDFDDRHEAVGADPGVAQPEAPHPVGAGPDAELFEDSDDVDTTPTPVATPMALAAASNYYTDLHAETPSGRHAAVEINEPGPSTTAIHLPLDDPHEAPQGYPIKADTKTGMYWSPDSRQYDDAIAEVWFASEEFARTNGFVRAD